MAKSHAARRDDAHPGSQPARRRLVAGRGRGDAPELDPLIHERMRLAIVSALAVQGWVSFADLKAAVDATDGNLSVHARRLEEAGYLECRKGFAGRVPRTEYRLTAHGRRALDAYLDHMEALIRRARAG